MNKANVKLDVLKKTIARLVKAAPARKAEPVDPLARIIRAFLEYDCDEARTVVAERKILENMVDFNELRVTPAIELAALLGVRYPFAESRCAALHRTLQSIFDREHHMRLDRIKEMKKGEIRPYFQSLAGITPYVEAAVSVDCFGIPAAPVDTKLLLWLISKDALPEGTDIRTAQAHLEKVLKAGEAEEFFHGSRREIDDWVPRSWPQVAKVPSPILAPPPIAGAVGAAASVDAAKAVVKEPVKEVKKAEPVKIETAKNSGETGKKVAATAAPAKKK
jgi:endonuclease III